MLLINMIVCAIHTLQLRLCFLLIQYACTGNLFNLDMLNYFALQESLGLGLVFVSKINNNLNLGLKLEITLAYITAEARVSNPGLLEPKNPGNWGFFKPENPGFGCP